MFDYIKIDISYLNRDKLFGNIHLNWIAFVDAKTGEIDTKAIKKFGKRKFAPKYIAEYNGLRFEWYDFDGVYKCYLLGSLPKYFSGGFHNNYKYSILNHIAVLRDLNRKFGIDPYKSSIHAVELSILIFESLYPMFMFIKNVLIHFTKGYGPQRYNYREHSSNSQFKICKRSQYDIKIYLRNLKYKIETISLAYEVFYRKMESLNKRGFKTLADTLDIARLKMVGEELQTQWDKSLVFDWTIDQTKLKKRDITKLLDYKNTEYWMDLNKDKRHYHKNKLRI